MMTHARRRVVLYLFLLLALTGSTRAQTGSIKTDLNTYPEPPLPTLPAAGGKFFDPTFGTEIMRVTDSSDGANAGTAYSYWPTFNKDNTWLWATADNGTSYAVLFRFDPTTYTLLGKELPPPLPGGGYFHSEVAIWSGTDPSVIYGLQSVGNKLWGYNAATRSYALIHDFTPDLPAGHYLWQMSRSMDDNVFAFTQKDATYNAVGFLVYRRSTNQVIYRRTTSDIDEVQIDKSGRYLVYKTGREGAGQIEVEIIDLLDGSVENLTDDAPDYAPGHSDNGNGNVVGADNWLNRITFRNLATPHTVRPLFNFNNMWDNAFHISQLADDERWTLSSFYGASASGLFRRELVQIATDGSQRVRRLAHHRSVFNNYYDSPRANISRDGRFIAFTSNWGGRPRRDLFIVKVPPIQTGAQFITWADVVNATPGANGSITKNVGGYWLASASSTQSLSGDGYVEASVNDTGVNPTRFAQVLGLNSGTTSPVEYYWGVSSGYAEVRVNNTWMGDTPVTTSDKLRIAVESGVVKFYKNATLIHTSSTAPSYPLRAYWDSQHDGVGLTSASVSGN
jgi:hypothetical protein